MAAEIRAELGRQKLSQVAFAAKLGKTEMYVSRRLADGTALDLRDLLDIADVLHVEVSSLLPGIAPTDVAKSLLPTDLMGDISRFAAALDIPVESLLARGETPVAGAA